MKRFTRDEFVNDEVYDDLKNQIYHGVITTCEAMFQDDLDRVNSTIERAQTLPIKTSELNDINILEKSGMCHDLVNDGEMRWVDNDQENADI